MTEWSFNEKSLLASILAVTVTACFYFDEVLEMLAAGNSNTGDIAVLAIVAVIILIVIEAIYHAILALDGDRETRDERDLAIRMRGAALEKLALELGIIGVIGHIAFASLFAPEKVNLFLVGNMLIAVLVVAGLVGRCRELWHYRRGL